MNKTGLLETAKPILFNTEMVQAILYGRKTVTRRPIKDYYKKSTNLEQKEMINLFARYKPGDYLYVRETFCRFECECCEGGHNGEKCDEMPDKNNGCYMYKATHDIWGDARWKPSIHMPKEAARIFLKVTAVRVERVGDITDEQAIKEGIRIGMGGEPFFSCRDAFISKFTTIYEKAHLNTWVWVYEFEVVEVDK